jgi:formyltetrahydrofolate-dependent phosphoribosylglycinamide formyltransferase
LKPIRIAVMISGHGRGTNMQAIIDACKDGHIKGEVAVVIGVREDAPAIGRAQSSNIKTVVLSPKDYPSVEDYDEAVFKTMQSNQVDLICLAGYMRMLGQKTVETYQNRIMNTHAALIPMFCGKRMYGMHVHESAIARGVKVSGCTVHFVDEEYDAGPIILQTVVPVEDDDNAESLAAKILPEEHKAYVRAIKLFSEGRLEVVDRRVRIKE